MHADFLIDNYCLKYKNKLIEKGAEINETISSPTDKKLNHLYRDINIKVTYNGIEYTAYRCFPVNPIDTPDKINYHIDSIYRTILNEIKNDKNDIFNNSIIF